MNQPPRSLGTPCSYTEPAGTYHRPRDLLPMLLRAGAERIETAQPAMDAHARIMRQAAAEIEALVVELKAATISLEISQRHVGELERRKPDREGATR